MVRHIVFYRFANEEDMLRASEVLLSMRGKVKMIREMEVGRDFVSSDRSFDLALMVTLDSPAALTEYQADPYHAQVVKPQMKALTTQSASVDYEITPNQ